MPKYMRINVRCELGGVARVTTDMGDTRARHGLGDAVSRQEPRLALIELPGAPQQREEIRGAHHQAIALAFALTPLDDHALGVDVGALKLTELGDPYARGIEGREDRAMFEVARRQNQCLDLVATESLFEKYQAASRLSIKRVIATY